MRAGNWSKLHHLNRSIHTLWFILYKDTKNIFFADLRFCPIVFGLLFNVYKHKLDKNVHNNQKKIRLYSESAFIAVILGVSIGFGNQ